MAKIKVRFKGDNPNSGYGFYQAGDVGTVVGYTQGLAVVIKEDGTFVKAELSHIVKMEEDTTQELEQDTSELTEFEEMFSSLIGALCGYTKGTCTDSYAKAHSEELLSIARKQLQPEFDKELELAYKNQDEVVYNRGYDKGREDERKEKVDDLISKEDIEQFIGDYEDEGHFRDLVLAYKQGIERVVEFIKEK